MILPSVAPPLADADVFQGDALAREKAHDVFGYVIDSAAGARSRYRHRVPRMRPLRKLRAGGDRKEARRQSHLRTTATHGCHGMRSS